MSYRCFLVVTFILFNSHALPTRAESKRPNIVILYADDWRHDTLGCAGNPIVQTPNLDALAKQGVRFTQNRVTTSICGVSRATLLTGQWMSRHGCKAFTKFDTPFTETYPGLLRSNGYHVGHVGKWHNGPFPAKEYDFGRSYMGTHWMQVNGQKVHVTQRNERDALEFLKSKPSDKPFCLTVAFFATHAEDSNKEQYLPQPESMKLYENVTIPVPKNATEESWKRLPPFFDNTNEGRRRWGWRFDTPEKYQCYMKNYYRLATEVDATCGKILAELKSQKLDENTLVIFTTDNGYFHGEHGLADKWYPHEESIRVPLIVRDPRMPPAKVGTTNDAMTLNVDLAPTILNCANLPAPLTMQGRDMSVLYREDNPPDWRREYFYEHGPIGKGIIPPSEALVRKDWKYMYWPEAKYEQLFDLVTDASEEKDLARDAKHTQKLAEMRKRFMELKAAAK
jgi:arylsulfatase